MFGDPSVSGFAKQADGLHPSEDLFDPFANALADLVGATLCRAPIKAGSLATLDAGNVRFDSSIAAFTNEVFGMIVFVGAKALR